MPELDANSAALLAQCDQGLAAVMHMAAERTDFEWRVVEAARTIDRQRQLYREGKSKADPDKYAVKAELYFKCKHIVGPGMPLSRACDVAIRGSQPYNVAKLTKLAEVVKECAALAKVPIRWGGDFTSIKDLPHFERHP